MTGKPDSETSLPPGCGLFFGWLFTTIAGTALGWALGWRASYIVPGLLSTLFLGAATGAILGAMQWLVLRAYLNGAGWWIAASAAGWMVGFAAGAELAQRLGMVEAWFGLAAGVMTGLSLGIFQWIFLRRRVTRSGVWLPVSVFAWASSLIYYQPGGNWMGVMYGALAGIVTGVAMLWLLFRPAAE